MRAIALRCRFCGVVVAIGFAPGLVASACAARKAECSQAKARGFTRICHESGGGGMIAHRG